MFIKNWFYLKKDAPGLKKETIENPSDTYVNVVDVDSPNSGNIMSVSDFAAQSRPYKVYTAQLTQGGGDDPLDIDSGLLTIGVTYMINNPSIESDFTNVGAPNNLSGTYFVATGTTPNNWGTGTNILTYNTGAPVANVVENTTGLNLYYGYNGVGDYRIFIYDNVLLFDKSVLVFVNGDSYTQDPDILVKANYTYEENLFYINAFDAGTPADNILSDSDRFSRTSIEIRVYN